MKTSVGHIQFLIDYKNVSYYKKLFEYFEWSVIVEMEGVIGFTNGEKTSLWFLEGTKKEAAGHTMYGMNHIGFSVELQNQVDEATEFIKTLGSTPLFETPRHRAEFASNEKETYYQVMFESPDKILLEVVYTGVKF